MQVPFFINTTEEYYTASGQLGALSVSAPFLAIQAAPLCTNIRGCTRNSFLVSSMLTDGLLRSKLTAARGPHLECFQLPNVKQVDYYSCITLLHYSSQCVLRS